MKPKLLLMSHGQMAQETLASAKMIVGDLAQADVVSMNAEDGLAGTKKKLHAILAQQGQQPILIIADLKGGTPCNVAMMAMGSYPTIRVLTGLNLAMVIEACVSQTESIDELAAYLQTIGQQAVTSIQLENDAEDDEEIEL